jgi:hypothetical protein
MTARGRGIESALVPRQRPSRSLRRLRRVRRPLLALLALLVALAIGYGVRAAHHDRHPHPAPSVTASIPHT